MKKLKLLLLILSVVLVSGFLQNKPISDGSESNGKKLYERYCSTCHGLDGTGEGMAAIYLNPKPRDFTRGLFKFQSTPAGSLPTDADVERTIRNGMPGSAMPAWDRLADQDRKDLTAYIKTFSEKFKTESPAATVQIGEPPNPTPQLIQEGKAVYALEGCWNCHGTTGTGDGPSAALLMDDWGKPIHPYNFTLAGAFKGGGAPKDIYKTFSTGVGGTPMPGYGEDALVPSREGFADLTFLEDNYSKQEISELRQFVAQLPTEDALKKMPPDKRKAVADARRWSLVYYVLSLAQPGKRQLVYTTTDHLLNAATVTSISQYIDPLSQRWNDLKETELALIALWQRDTPTDRVVVRSVTDGAIIVFQLAWDDPTKNDDALQVSKFGDGAAVQFPLDPASDPFFGMGDTSAVVNIWQWKSLWEKDLQQYAGVNAAFPAKVTDFYPYDVSGGSRAEYFATKDSAKKLSMTWNAGWGSGNLLSAQARTSSVEDLNAKGFGTLTSQPLGEQNVQGKGVWKNGKWFVTFTRSLGSSDKKDVVLKPGTTLPVSFAVWVGSLSDRNGQKMVTNWYRLTIGTK
jgi:mono/diheme cytochrome c family protein